MRDPVEIAKDHAARKALDFIRDKNIIGIGTGSTIAKLIEYMALEKKLFSKKYYVSTSYDTAIKLSKIGFKVLNMLSIDTIDVYVDGADEVDNKFNMVKGRGAALFLEKMLAYFSEKRIFIVDYTKLVNILGSKKPIPVEVSPLLVTFIIKKLEKLGLNPKLRYAKGGKDGPIITDLGNFIVDLYVKAENPSQLHRTLKEIPGIIETGIFVNYVDVLVIGYPDRVEVRINERKNNRILK